MAKTRRPTLIEQAGPSRTPAAVLHPEDPLPKTWRVVTEWTWRGQRGAWLERTGAGGSWHFDRPETPTLAQVIYRTTAKRSPRTSTTGQALNYASRGLVCAPWALHWAALPREFDYRAAAGTEAQGEADKAARAQHLAVRPEELHALDKAEVDRYVARVRADALKSDPLGKLHEDDQLIEGWANWVVRRTFSLGDIDSALVAFDVEMGPSAKAWGQTIRPMVEARARATLARRSTPRPAAGRPTPRRSPAAPEPSQRPLEAPPDPGVDRAKWIGQRVTEMVAREDSVYLPHTRRRIAAHRALAYVTGYEAGDPENDGPTLPGPFSLHLEGLNAYAARVFAGGPTIGGTENAVL